MRVLVAGATSVLGLPTLAELLGRGHEVYGLTRSRRGADLIAAAGAVPVMGDATDRTAMRTALERTRPQALASLLVTLPRYGPRRMRDFRATVRLWQRGVPTLLDAAAEAGVERVVAESVIFAYGLARHEPDRIDESHVPDEPDAADPGAWVLSALHAMERRVLDDRRFAGSVLRYGLLHGPSVPTTRLLVSLMRWRLPVIPGRGRGVLSWVELSDAARATAGAVTAAEAGHVYNIVDDQPVAFAAYAAALAQALNLPPARHLPAPLARLTMPYTTLVFDGVRIPATNRKARQRLGWEPRYPSVHELAPLLKL